MELALGNMNVGKVPIRPYHEYHTYFTLQTDLKRQFRIDQILQKIGSERNLTAWKRRLHIDN